jgi:hypothetical protein
MVFAAGCAVGGGTDDEGSDESDVTVAGITEGSFEAAGVHEAANTATLTELDITAKLTSTAAKAIINYRKGADGALGTADDRKLATLAELDALPYVAATAIQQLLAYARSKGWVPPQVLSSMMHRDFQAGGTCVHAWSCRNNQGWPAPEVRLPHGLINLSVHLEPGGAGVWGEVNSASYDGWAGASAAVIESQILTGLHFDVPTDGSEKAIDFGTALGDLTATGKLGPSSVMLGTAIGPATDLINRHTCADGLTTNQFTASCTYEIAFPAP